MRPPKSTVTLLADFCDDSEIVRDEEKGGAVPRLHFGDEAQDLLLHGHVERGRRLVGDDELGLRGKGGGDQHPLPHAARELVRVARQHPIRIGDVHLGQKIARALARLGAGQAEDRGEPVGDLAVDAADRVEGGERVLRDEGGGARDEPPALARAEARSSFSPSAHRARAESSRRAAGCRRSSCRSSSCRRRFRRPGRAPPQARA